MMRPGPRNLITDVEGLLVGQAQDDNLRSGVTVLFGEAPFTAAVDIMGGAPGTRETDLLVPHRLVASVDAIVLSGGSAFGLDAASGVADTLRARGRGFAIGDVRVPIVPAAIIFDLLNGGDKDWSVNPYPALGRAALEAAARDFRLGSEGAGTGAMTATLMGGVGSASYRLDDGITVGALAVVNAFGDAVAPGGREFWAGAFEEGGEFGGLGPVPRRHDATRSLIRKPRATGANTTIAVVATDACLDKAGAARLAEAAQDGIARALVPAHTPFDGDLVFAAATGAQPLVGDRAEMMVLLGHAAALCLSRAIARAVFAARPRPGNPLPCWCELAEQGGA
jgi:L-aminopeptidase/D-esterase-like protein